MSDTKLVIRREKLPTRCEVCHQSDQFDPLVGKCLRCHEVLGKPEVSALGDLLESPHRGLESPQTPLPRLFCRLRELGVLTVLLTILLSIVMPNYLSARRAANMASAQQTLRNLNTAQVTYSLGFGKGNYTARLQDFYTGYCDLGFLDNTVIEAQTKPKSGYLLSPITCTVKTETAEPTYFVVNYPVCSQGPFRTGDDCYFIDDSGIIRHSKSPAIWPTFQSPLIE